MGVGEEFEDSPLARALDAEVDEAFEMLQTGFERLLDIADRGDLGALGPRRLIALAQRFESHRSRLAAVDAGIVEAATDERLDAFTCSRSLAVALADVLRISRATAKARITAAAQILPLNGFSAGPQSARLPALAAAVRDGSVSDDQARVIGAAMRTLATNPQIDTETAQRAERMMLDQAAALGPEDLRSVAAKLDDVLLPGGILPREQLARARRGLSIGPAQRDGTHRISGTLTRVAYTRLMSVLSPLAAPRSADDLAGPDPRTPEHRMHDALEDACSRLLDSAGLPRSGGTPATVHITIDADRLLAAVADDSAYTRAAGITSFGERLTFGEIVQLAEQARIIPAYLSSTRGIIAYGAQRRCASEAQTQALIARDLGCSFPGCDAPAEWCERHHVIPWYRGGPTDLSNLTLVCGYHHREFEKRGWRVVMALGLPTWIPPAWLDPEQRPMVNTRIAEAHGHVIDPASVLAALETADRHAEPEGDDRLDAVDDLVNLLAQHVGPDEREEFAYEIGLVLGGYLGPGAPAQRALQPVA